jgi:parvulin-like peptidyl-prolyl isomerase
MNSRSLSPLFAGALLMAAAAQAEPVPINWLSALVNDVPITYKDVYDGTVEEEQRIRQEYRNQPQVREKKISQLKADVLSLLVERQLILSEFKSAGYQVPQSLVDDYIRATIREKFGDRARMIQTLAKQGVTYEAYRKTLQEDFIIGGMTTKNVGGEVLISPYKIEKYYNENIDKFKVDDMLEMRMIVLAYRTGRDEVATKKFAEELREKIVNGASFADTAKAYSDGSQRSEGGSWPEVYRKTLREDLADVAFSLKPGEMSPVLEKRDGCYIMQLEKSVPAHTKTLSEVRDEIEQILRRQEQQRARDQWINRLKGKSFVLYIPPP